MKKTRIRVKKAPPDFLRPSHRGYPTYARPLQLTQPPSVHNLGKDLRGPPLETLPFPSTYQMRFKTFSATIGICV